LVIAAINDKTGIKDQVFVRQCDSAKRHIFPRHPAINRAHLNGLE
jgi:hypothetical protein